jgi:hypothetical protein
MMLGASANSVTFADSALAAVAGLRVLADGRGLGRCRRAIEGPAVGLVLRLNCFARGLPDFAFAIVALTWAVVTFSPPAARSMISSRGYLAPI